jgi:hypothetical protein
MPQIRMRRSMGSLRQNTGVLSGPAMVSEIRTSVVPISPPLRTPLTIALA